MREHDMELAIILLLGGIVGWLAAKVAGRDEGFIASIVIGIIGSFIGDFLSTIFIGTNQSYLGFTWIGLFWSFIGALVLVIILNAIQHRPRRTNV